MNLDSRKVTLVTLIIWILLWPMSASAAGAEKADSGLSVLPDPPITGKTFSVVFDAPACQVFFSEGPLDRVVEVVGSTVRVTVEHIESQVCLPTPIFSWAWTLGPLPAGTYTLVLVGHEPFEGGQTYELAQIPLSVLPTDPLVVPTTDPWVLALLALLLGAVAFVVVRRLGAESETGPRTS